MYGESASDQINWFRTIVSLGLTTRHAFFHFYRSNSVFLHYDNATLELNQLPRRAGRFDIETKAPKRQSGYLVQFIVSMCGFLRCRLVIKRQSDRWETRSAYNDRLPRVRVDVV